MPVTGVASDAQENYREGQRQESARPSGGFLQRKYGPLPGWAWSLLIAGGGVAYFLWRKRQAAGSTTGTGTGAGYSGTGTGYGGVTGDYGPELATIQSEIQQLQSGEGQQKKEDQQEDKVKVPNVVGIDLNRAHDILQDAGLSVNTSGSSGGKGRAGFDRLVSAQNPKAGASVKKGSHVSLTWHWVKQTDKSKHPATKGKK